MGDYILLKRGIVILNNYVIPKALAQSVDKKLRTRLKIDHNEVRTRYANINIKDLFTPLENLTQQDVIPHPVYDRMQTLKYAVTRKRAAATIAFVSGI